MMLHKLARRELHSRTTTMSSAMALPALRVVRTQNVHIFALPLRGAQQEKARGESTRSGRILYLEEQTAPSRY